MSSILFFSVFFEQTFLTFLISSHPTEPIKDRIFTVKYIPTIPRRIQPTLLFLSYSSGLIKDVCLLALGFIYTCFIASARVVELFANILPPNCLNSLY
jgi:hypothetical protein